MYGVFVFFSMALQARTFTDSNGKVIEADLISHSGGKVKIKRADGKEFDVDPSVFSKVDQEFIKGWMKKTPEFIDYNLHVEIDKKKLDGDFTDHDYKRVKNEQWYFLLEVTNRSQQTVSNLKIEYRILYTDAARGSYRSSDTEPIRMVEGSQTLKQDLETNRTAIIKTKPVQIDTVDYDYGARYKDDLKGCLIRIVGPDGQTILEETKGLSMKNKTWANTTPHEQRKEGGKIIIR